MRPARSRRPRAVRMIRIMRYRTLGDSGLLVSVVGLGCNNFGRRTDQADPRGGRRGHRHGITFFDTADDLRRDGGSELSSRRALEGPPRPGRPGHQVRSPARTWATARRRRQGRPRATSGSRWRSPQAPADRLHRPVPAAHPGPADPDRGDASPRSTSSCTEGKVRYIGHSNLSGWQLADAAHTARDGGRTAFISAQNHWSLLERGAEREVVPAARPLRPRRAALLPAGERPAHRQGHARRRRSPRHPADRPRAGYVTDAKLDKVEALIAWGAGAGGVHPGDRDRRPRRAARLLVGHRGRDLPRAGQGQRGRGRVGADAGPAGGDRQDRSPARGVMLSDLPERTVAPAARPPGCDEARRPSAARLRGLVQAVTDVPNTDAYDTSGVSPPCRSRRSRRRSCPGRTPRRHGEERPAARPVGVAAAVELELGGAEDPHPVHAQHRLRRPVRIADHLDQRGRLLLPPSSSAPVMSSMGTPSLASDSRKKATSSSWSWADCHAVSV